MLIIPAIDLQNNKCVRLTCGKFNESTVYSDDPLQVAKNFEKQGAKWLHVIDLDGAQTGQLVNYNIVEQIIKNTNLKIQFGGGVRDENVISEIKTNRIIVSTLAIKNPEIINNKKIIVSLDCQDESIMVKGWQEKSNINIFNFIKQNRLRQIIYTDVDRDGTLSGPNFTMIKRLTKICEVIVAGGVRDEIDLQTLAMMNIYAVIIGKALYTNKSLKQYVSQKNYTMPGC
ncbi:MAG: 1-(5-phosphoribosyl)-5-[(5-phosphoribosylamino)methylideneamino]imidazole-4-carboxamide isomerase [Patescibacteria group bacterium]